MCERERGGGWGGWASRQAGKQAGRERDGDRGRQTDRQDRESNLVFYTQSTISVISGRDERESEREFNLCNSLGR